MRVELTNFLSGFEKYQVNRKEKIMGALYASLAQPSTTLSSLPGWRSLQSRYRHVASITQMQKTFDELSSNLDSEPEFYDLSRSAKVILQQKFQKASQALENLTFAREFNLEGYSSLPYTPIYFALAHVTHYLGYTNFSGIDDYDVLLHVYDTAIRASAFTIGFLLLEECYITICDSKKDIEFTFKAKGITSEQTSVRKALTECFNALKALS